jgi:hypothetical protein
VLASSSFKPNNPRLTAAYNGSDCGSELLRALLRLSPSTPFIGPSEALTTAG